MPCTHRHTLATLFSAQRWLADQVRGCRLTPAPPTPSLLLLLLRPGPPFYSPPTIPGESIQLNGWLQTGGLGAGMFLWHCRAQIPLSTGEQLNHSSLITVKAALAPAPTTTKSSPLSFARSPTLTPKIHTYASFTPHALTEMDFDALVLYRGQLLMEEAGFWGGAGFCLRNCVHLPLSSPLYSAQFSNMSFTSATNSSLAMYSPSLSFFSMVDRSMGV